jgi:hypothetical protein
MDGNVAYDEEDPLIIKLWKTLRSKRFTMRRMFDQFDADETDSTLNSDEWLLFLEAVLSSEWQFIRPNEKW